MVGHGSISRLVEPNLQVSVDASNKLRILYSICWKVASNSRTMERVRHYYVIKAAWQINTANLLYQNQTFHYIRRITPKRVTSWRCTSPRHSAKATQLPA